MREYHNIIENTLTSGTIEKNRTKEYTLSTFGYNYQVDLSQGYPLLTTKKMDTFRWDSMLHEIEWYLSGEHHIRSLTEQTGIWDAWADENHNLPSAYGRFWRRYPVPQMDSQLQGESWLDSSSPWTQREQAVYTEFVYGSNHTNPVEVSMKRLKQISGHLPDDIRTYIDSPSVESTDDHVSVTIPIKISHNSDEKIDIAVRTIRNEVDAYHITVESSVLTFDQLQFNIDALTDENPYRGPESRRLIVNAWHPANAQSSHLPPCHFVYLFNVQDGKLNLHLTQRSADIALGVPFNIAAYALIGQLVAEQTQYGYDHLPGLLEQLSRRPMDRPNLRIDDDTGVNNLSYEDFKLLDYESHSGISFGVAE